MGTLYEISDDYRNLLNMDLDADTLADTLESLTDEFDTKAESICKVLKENEVKIEGIDAEIKRLGDRKKTMSNKAESLKNYLKDNMELLGHTKIEKELFTISVIAGKPILEVANEEAIPENYFNESVARKLDRKTLLTDLKGGKEVIGAAIGTGKSGLRIY